MDDRPAVAASESTAARPSQFDVFLSHNSRDKPFVERIAEKLRRAGLEPWLDKWQLTPGGRWQEELAAGLAKSSACAVFIGITNLGDWEREELGVAQNRAATERDFRLFPVLLPGLPDPFHPRALPPFLSTRTWVDLRRGVEDTRALQNLVNAVKGVPFGPETPLEPRSAVEPYRGLQTFDEAQAEFFFGRAGDVQRLLEKLKASRALAVVGPSGSGKSSLVRAGLVPAVRRGALPGTEEWHVCVLRPGAHPLTVLAAQLVRMNPQETMQRTLDGLRSDERMLHLAVALALVDDPPERRVLWVVDQAEEVFTLCRDDHERGSFLDNLLYASSVPDGRCVVVLTLRADFYPMAAAYPGLAQQLAEQQFLVSPLQEAGLRQAIEEPARRVGLELESGLVDTILDDVRREPGALPLLEHALLELWQRRRGRLLTLEAYRESGGVERALARRAEEIFATFTPAQQRVARRVFLRLTQPGEGTEDTRRRAALSELAPSDEERDDIERVVSVLVDARMLTTTGDEGSERWVDVSHEALIRGWPRLRSWIDEDRAGLLVHRRLTEAADEWLRLGRDPGVLHRGARLVAAREWRERNESALNDLERQFLAASVELEAGERRARRRRVRLAVGGLLVAVASLSAVAVWALTQRADARRQERVAVSQHLAGEVRGQLDEGRDARAILLALESLAAWPTEESREALRAVLESLPVGLVRTLGGGHGAVSAVEVSRDGTRLAAADEDGTVTVWRTASSTPLASFRFAARDVALSADGSVLAVAGRRGIAVRNLDTGSSKILQDDPDGSIGFVQSEAIAISLNPRGELLAATSGDFTVLWDVRSGRPIGYVASYDAGGFEAIFSPDGRYLATADANGVAVWSATASLADMRRAGAGGSAALENVFDWHERTVYAIAFDSTSTTLVGGTPDGIRAWNVITKRDLLLGPTTDKYEARLVALTGGTIVTSGLTSTLALRSARTASEVSEFGSGHGAITSLAVSLEGDVIATGSADGTVLLWNDVIVNPTPSTAQQLLCPLAGRNLTDDEWAALVGPGRHHRTCGQWQ